MKKGVHLGWKVSVLPQKRRFILNWNVSVLSRKRGRLSWKVSVLPQKRGHFQTGEQGWVPLFPVSEGARFQTYKWSSSLFTAENIHTHAHTHTHTHTQKQKIITQKLCALFLYSRCPTYTKMCILLHIDEILWQHTISMMSLHTRTLLYHRQICDIPIPVTLIKKGNLLFSSFAKWPLFHWFSGHKLLLIINKTLTF